MGTEQIGKGLMHDDLENHSHMTFVIFNWK
jgi:hypothetical protein